MYNQYYAKTKTGINKAWCRYFKTLQHKQSSSSDKLYSSSWGQKVLQDWSLFGCQDLIGMPQLWKQHRKLDLTIFYVGGIPGLNTKRNTTKFEIKFQNNLWIYLHNFFTSRKSKQSLIMIWLIILSSNSCQKGVGHNDVPLNKIWRKFTV